LSLLSILSTWLFLQFSPSRRDSRLFFSLYILVNILGTFTHIAFFFLLFAQTAVHFMLNRRRRMQRLVVGIVLSLVPYLFLWGPILLHQVANSREGVAWVKKPGLFMLVDFLLQFGGAFWLVVPVILYLKWRSGSKPSNDAGKLLTSRLPLWLLGITLLTPLLISEVKPIFNSRLAIVGLHLFALSVGAVLDRGANYLLPLALIVLTLVCVPVIHPELTPCDNREMARHLSQTAKDDDVVVFTSLTRLPIDFYLKRSASRKTLFETSFPADIDRHPGYEGRLNDPARKPALEREAQELVDRIARMQYERFFFLHGFHPEIDSILEQKLRTRFALVPGEALQCGEATYFHEVSVYK
jgi:hypothetical protein